MIPGPLIHMVVDDDDPRDLVVVDGAEMSTAEAGEYIGLRVWLSQLRTVEDCEAELERLRDFWRDQVGDGEQRARIVRDAGLVQGRREELVGGSG
jgi:hypothetical protein